MKLLWILFLSATLNRANAKGLLKLDYSYTIVDAFANSSSKDIFDVSFNVKQISRGIYGLKGFYNVYTELDDRQFFDMKLLRSSSGNSDFKPFSSNFSNMTLSDFFNGPYKMLLMTAIKDCIPQLPQIGKERWSPPLKPFQTSFDNCNIIIENAPTHMPRGYYKTIALGSGMANLYFEFLFLID